MSTYTIPNINDYKPKIVDAAFYADIRFDADDTAPDYIGLHETNGASTSTATWKIYKFTYSGGAVTRIQLAYGAWDNRATLF
jgi:hypothetical protein